MNVQVVSIGVALFAMFFGAGNVVFPLDLGRVLGDQVPVALLGIFISAVLMPLIGIFAGCVFDGDYKVFFERIGIWPGAILAFFCMVLIGPFGAIPRILTVSHGGLSWYFPNISLVLFTICAGALVLFFSLARANIVGIIGKYLGPLKVALLSLIIISGLFTPCVLVHTQVQPIQNFVRGFIEGYWTLDLLGAIFFARFVTGTLRKDAYSSPRALLADLFKAGALSAFLLGAIYAGFMLLGALQGARVPATVGREQLIYALADVLLGRWGVLSSFTVALACLVTAIALTAAFADYLSTMLFAGRLPYKAAVVFTVFVSSAFANLGFEGIMHAIAPVVKMCYPALIVLSLCNIAYKLWDMQWVKVPVYITLLVTIWYYYADCVLSFCCMGCV